MTTEELALQAQERMLAADLEQAQTLAVELSESAPGHPVANWILGVVAIRDGDLPGGYALLEQSIAAEPRNPAVHLAMADVFERVGSAEQAFLAYQNTLKLTPKDADVHVRLAKLLITVRRDGEAIESLLRAVSLAPERGETRILLAQALSGANRGDEAHSHLVAALADPTTAGVAHGMLGYWHQSRGQFAAARDQFEQSIEVEPRRALAYYGLTQGNRVKPEDRPMLDKIERLVEDVEIIPEERLYMEYALGKGWADLGEYEASWRHFERANTLALQTALGGRKFDRRRYTDTVDGTLATFGRDFFKKHRNIGANQKLPIFIVGMMRSGTTLVEQILSSHPDVGAAGEVPFWLDEGYVAVDLDKRTIDAKQLNRLTLRYLEGLRFLAMGKTMVTDKMPQNFQMLGLIHTALPKAPIIHIRRNPLDTCISIYTNAYQTSPEFAHDPESIVFAYRQYLRMMAHWRKVLPPEQFLEIDYEDLTSKPDFVIRQLVSFCRLPWNDACLRPEHNDRLVTTPSVWQVRQPMYRTAVERWRVYEPWLGAFDALKSI